MGELRKDYNENTFPLDNEEFVDYRYRITKNKDNYNLTWQDIKDLCMCFYNEKVSDNWRKYVYYCKEKEDIELKDCNRILAISDIHIPFNLDISIFSDYRNKVDTLVINGDLLDCYSLSKFTKLYRQPLIDELTKAREYTINLVNYIKPKKIIVVSGNHEIRLGKVIADKIGTDLLDLMPTDAMAFLFDTGFNQYNHQDKTKVMYEPLNKVFEEEGIETIYANNFWYKEGRTIFVHPLAFRQNPLSTSVKAYEYFIGKGMDFDTIVMAHTHKLGFCKYSNYNLYEQGCCCELSKMNYMDMRLPKTEQTNGFMYIIQDANGNLVYEKTKLISI